MNCGDNVSHFERDYLKCELRLVLRTSPNFYLLLSKRRHARQNCNAGQTCKSRQRWQGMQKRQRKVGRTQNTSLVLLRGSNKMKSKLKHFLPIPKRSKTVLYFFSFFSY